MASKASDPVLDLWELRFNQKNERCLAELPTLKEAYGIPLGPVAGTDLEKWIGKLLQDPETRIPRARILLLSSSLLRTQGRGAESALWAKTIARFFDQTPADYFVRFEQGINLFARGDSHSALEYFAQARRLAPRPIFELAAEINTLLCLENLGLPFEETLSRALAQAKKMGEEARGARTQLEAFELRRAFRRGTFAPFLSFSSGEQALTQADYFRLWVRQLPYHRAFSPLSEAEYKPFTENRDFFYQNSFRLRTLQGASHPADWETLKPSEFAHRFYLWAWKWLSAPDRNQVRKTASIVSRSGILGEDTLLDRESQALVRNALLWLCLFDPSSHSRIQPLADQLRRPEWTLFPVLALESDLIHALTVLRDGGPEAPEFQYAHDALESSPLWSENETHFKSLFLSVVPSDVAGDRRPEIPAGLKKLKDHLRELLASSIAPHEAPILVEVARSRIADSRSGEQLISEPMARALELLNREVSVSQEQFLAFCFGIKRFDPVIHQTKINNLLQRLRKLAGSQLAFRTKSGQVFAEGDWRQFEFVRPAELGIQLIESEEWKNLGIERSSPVLQGAQPRLRSRVQVDSLKWSGVLSRSEIESKLQLPRSTTNRLLAQWERAGHVSREGAGRQVRYRRVL